MTLLVLNQVSFNEVNLLSPISQTLQKDVQCVLWFQKVRDEIKKKNNKLINKLTKMEVKQLLCKTDNCNIILFQDLRL